MIERIYVVTNEKVKSVIDKFPLMLWEASIRGLYKPLYLCPVYVGSPSYALYTTGDGMQSKRLHLSQLQKDYFDNEDQMLQVVIARQKSLLDDMEARLKTIRG